MLNMLRASKTECMILCNFNGHCFPSKDIDILSGCWRCSSCDQGLNYNGSSKVHVAKWNRTQNKINVVCAGKNFKASYLLYSLYCKGLRMY